jgi:DNA-binding winged helix-turn-helix (wHTH) protein
VTRYRFSDFTLSPQRRLLLRDGREVPLIPRYFDLLVLLVTRRHEAVHRREIFESVWADVSVSDSALSQAVRTIRRTLGDDSSEPRFIRTVPRHGYRFVLPDVIEEEDDGAPPAVMAGMARPEAVAAISWGRASAGSALAGSWAGGFGGVILAMAPGSAAPIAIVPVLAVIGGGLGALAGAGVGAGLSLAEERATSYRALALIAGAASGGALAGSVAQWLGRWALAALLGLDVSVGGGLAGLAIGTAAGVGYANVDDGRLRAALMIGALCGLAGLALTLGGQPLVGGTIHAIANAADGSPATLAPLGRLVGEPDFGPVSRSILAFGEAATFGVGLAFGLRRRR